MQNQSLKIYFPGLNGLRFIAAFLVIVNHVETSKYYAGYNNYMHYPFFTSVGGLSVTLFFVLSGFLITYLLLNEKENMGFINIKKFYIKRILRIWPLYFLIVFSTLFIFNKVDFFYVPELSKNVPIDFGIIFFLFLVILPNIVAVVFPSIPYLHHVWSIGVEEQFYLIWPWIIRFTRNYLKIFFIIIVAMIIISAGIRFTANHIKEITNDPTVLKIIRDINVCFSMFRVSCMAIGGIGAWSLFYKKEKFLQVICRKDVQWATILLTFILFVINPNIMLIKHEFYSVLFCIIIINLASNRKPVLYLENKVFNFLGTISYGIYIYHPVAIAICIGILRKINGYTFGNPLSDIILYTMTVTLTVTIASTSYYLLENKFLKLRNKLNPTVSTQYV